MYMCLCCFNECDDEEDKKYDVVLKQTEYLINRTHHV